jgi:putative membrane protein
MTDDTITPEAAVPAPSDSTRLAVDRTRLAFERTTMAWVRTATSLITFGFSVYKFFQIETHRDDAAGRLIGPREFALTMITIGIVSLVFATLQQRHSMQIMRVHYQGMRVPRSLAVVIAALMSVLGILALVTVFLRR